MFHWYLTCLTFGTLVVSNVCPCPSPAPRSRSSTGTCLTRGARACQLYLAALRWLSNRIFGEQVCPCQLAF